MNKCQLIGRICSDVEKRTTQDGTAVVTYRLAVDRRVKREGQQNADFLSCVVWGKGAEFAANYFVKGMKVAVCGRIQTRDYTNSEGRKIYVTEIVVEDQEFCEKKADTADAAPKYAAPYVPQYTDADVPPVTPTVGSFEDISADDDLPF